MTIDPEALTIRTGGSTFTYLERGAGTPLVLLHGVGSAARSWRHQVDNLSHAFRVIAWDAPGYGGSTCLEPEHPDADDYAAGLARFLEALNVDRFHLVGHSFGCVTAARFARLHPERIVTLTLASIAGGSGRLTPQERERARNLRLDDLRDLGPRGLAEKRGPRLVSANASEPARRSVIDTMALVRPDGYTQAVWMLSNADTRADLARLPPDMRVQIIYGDADVITTPEQNQAIAGARPGVRVHVVKGPGHALYIEQPEAFNRLLLEFMM